MEHATFFLEQKYTHTHTHREGHAHTLHCGIFPLLSRLHVYHLPCVLLKYGADVISLSFQDVMGAGTKVKNQAVAADPSPGCHWPEN